MKAPENWAIASLDDVAEVQSGLSKSANRQGDTVRKPYLRTVSSTCQK